MGVRGRGPFRPALERLRDLIAQVGVDVVLCCAPDRLARKFAYQALLIEEFARAGTRVEFVRGPRGDSPEDQLMVQFQGMFAEYEIPAGGALSEREDLPGTLGVGECAGRRPVRLPLPAQNP